MQRMCTCAFLHGNETSEIVVQQLDKALEGQQEYQGEICFYRKNGEDLVFILSHTVLTLCLSFLPLLLIDCASHRFMNCMILQEIDSGVFWILCQLKMRMARSCSSSCPLKTSVTPTEKTTHTAKKTVRSCFTSFFRDCQHPTVFSISMAGKYS